MRVAAKSTIDPLQLKERVRKGARYIELHTLEEHMRDRTVEENLQILAGVDVEVAAVHLPITSKYTFEGLQHKESFEVIERCFEMAERLSEYNGGMIEIIMHYELNVRQSRGWGILDKCVERMGYLLDKYKHVSVGLENLQILCEGEKEDVAKIEGRNSYGFENIELVKIMRARLNTQRVGVVIDTCHALTTIRYIQTLYPAEQRQRYKVEYSLRDYFERAKGYIRVIHLANSVGNGLSAGHGVGFDTQEDEKLFEEIMQYIGEVEFQGLLTLEVQEQDYGDCKVFEKLKLQVEEYMEHKLIA